MFDNIDKKIKALAVGSCWVGIAASVIIGIATMIDEDFFVGLLIVVLGSLSAWLGSFVLYGFGELIEVARQILSKLNGDAVQNIPFLKPKAPPTEQRQFVTTQGVSSPTPPPAAPVPPVHQWKCETCGKMISKDVCPFCGKVYGRAVERVAALQQMVKNGTLTPEEYDAKIEAMKYE